MRLLLLAAATLLTRVATELRISETLSTTGPGTQSVQCDDVASAFSEDIFEEPAEISCSLLQTSMTELKGRGPSQQLQKPAGQFMMAKSTNSSRGAGRPVLQDKASGIYKAPVHHARTHAALLTPFVLLMIASVAWYMASRSKDYLDPSCSDVPIAIDGENPGSAANVQSGWGQLSPSAFVLTMFVECVAPGLLSMAYTMKYVGYCYGLLMLLFLYGISVSTMWAVGRTAEITSEYTYAGQWKAAVGEHSVWFPLLMVIGTSYGNLVTYAMDWADIFTTMFARAAGYDMPRWVNLVCFTLFPTLPLCLLKRFPDLKLTNALAAAAIFFTTFAVCFRHADGSYLAGGKFYAQVPEEPHIPKHTHIFYLESRSFACLNTLGTAFLCHYNGCKYYRELHAHEPGRFCRLTALAMGLGVVVYAIFGIFSHHTFGWVASGMVLENYSPYDGLINIARVGMGLSLIFVFPIGFNGLRENTISFMRIQYPTWARNLDIVWKQDMLSIALCLFTTGSAVILTENGMVTGIVGAFGGGTTICFIPAVLILAAMSRFRGSEGHTKLRVSMTCIAILGVLYTVGACLGLVFKA